MPKLYGVIGFAVMNQSSPGVVKEDIVERSYFGDLVRNTRALQSTDQVNDNVNISNELSIVADPYSQQNFHAMRYAKFMGAKWKITNVEVRYPRLILSLGGVYNGQ